MSDDRKPDYQRIRELEYELGISERPQYRAVRTTVTGPNGERAAVVHYEAQASAERVVEAIRKGKAA
jgi:hypothetical protein